MELVEFAEFLESKGRRDKSLLRDEVLAAYGAFRDCLPLTEEFQFLKHQRLKSRIAGHEVCG